MLDDNFVDIVGYQLEKVHTGVISWLLDSKNTKVPFEDKIKILKKLYEIIPPLPLNNIKIKPTQEYSFGRSKRIDLVVELELDKNKHFIVIECKTDSDVDITQLRNSKTSFEEKHGNNKSSFYVFLLGASQFTYQHKESIIKKELGYKIIDLSNILEIFSDLSIKGKNKIYDDWYNALQKENERSMNIDQELKNMNNPWDEQLKGLGYRIGLPVFYLYYAKLRDNIEKKSPYKKWGIYSGTNNAVMNWQDGWIDIDGNELLWEFNNELLVLKAHIKRKNDNLKNKVRTIRTICDKYKEELGGERTKDRKGEYISLYKWEFNFCKDTIEINTKKVISILERIHDELKKVSYA